jgi:hypothetical protein
VRIAARNALPSSRLPPESITASKAAATIKPIFTIASSFFVDASPVVNEHAVSDLREA